jgi:hypothetical protein
MSATATGAAATTAERIVHRAIVQGIRDTNRAIQGTGRQVTQGTGDRRRQLFRPQVTGMAAIVPAILPPCQRSPLLALGPVVLQLFRRILALGLETVVHPHCRRIPVHDLHRARSQARGPLRSRANGHPLSQRVQIHSPGRREVVHKVLAEIKAWEPKVAAEEADGVSNPTPYKFL